MIEIRIKTLSTQFTKQMSLTNNPDYFWDSFLAMTHRVVSSNHLALSSDPRLIILFKSSPRRVNMSHRVTLAE